MSELWVTIDYSQTPPEVVAGPFKYRGVADRHAQDRNRQGFTNRYTIGSIAERTRLQCESCNRYFGCLDEQYVEVAHPFCSECADEDAQIVSTEGELLLLCSDVQVADETLERIEQMGGRA